MAMWSEDDLTRIGDAGEIQIVTRRPNGMARQPVTIWVVRVDDDLYVRAVRGRFGGWYQATLQQPAGQILVGDRAHDVRFEPAGTELSDAIDDAYRTKYHDKSPTHVTPIVSPSAREATLRLVPHGHQR